VLDSFRKKKLMSSASYQSYIAYSTSTVENIFPHSNILRNLTGNTHLAPHPEIGWIVQLLKATVDLCIVKFSRTMPSQSQNMMALMFPASDMKFALCW
jgi:hypothetical protein